MYYMVNIVTINSVTYYSETQVRSGYNVVRSDLEYGRDSHHQLAII